MTNNRKTLYNVTFKTHVTQVKRGATFQLNYCVYFTLGTCINVYLSVLLWHIVIVFSSISLLIHKPQVLWHAMDDCCTPQCITVLYRSLARILFLEVSCVCVEKLACVFLLLYKNHMHTNGKSS